MDKYHVAHILKEIGWMIELTDPNPKKGWPIKERQKSFYQWMISKKYYAKKA